jgi:hypothetical protein
VRSHGVPIHTRYKILDDYLTDSVGRVGNEQSGVLLLLHLIYLQKGERADNRKSFCVEKVHHVTYRTCRLRASLPNAATQSI